MSEGSVDNATFESRDGNETRGARDARASRRDEPDNPAINQRYNLIITRRLIHWPARVASQRGRARADTIGRR